MKETEKELETLCPCPDERWKDVPGFESIYAVSSCGRILRTRHSQGTRAGILKPEINVRGYSGVHLKSFGKRLRRSVAHIVMLAFVGPAPSGQQVNHKDADKTNGHLTNLEYLTPSANIRHALSLGLRHGKRKLLPEQVLVIRNSGSSFPELASQYCVSEQTIRRVHTGRSWSWL